MGRNKLEHIPKINRRLFKMWSNLVRKNNTCEYCGIKKGEITNNGKPAKLDAHHLINRNIKDSPLKWSLENGICLCAKCHKFSQDNSFHLNPVKTITWMLEHYPEKIEYVNRHYKTRVNLQDREILYAIEEKLKEGKSPDIEELKKNENKRRNKKRFGE